MSEKAVLRQSDAERIVTDSEEPSDDVQQKPDLMLKGGQTRERIEEYLNDRIQDTLTDCIITVPIPGAARVEMDRSVLDDTHGSPHSIGVEQ